MPIIKPSRKFEGSDPALGPLSPEELQEAIEDLMGSILWISKNEEFCSCPGSHLHTTRDADKDCKIYLEPVPTISCFHSSCRIIVEETTRNLGHLMWGGIEPSKKKLTPEETAKIAQVRAREAMRRQAATSRRRILRDYAWTYDEIRKDSPQKVPDSPARQWREHLSIFNKDDVIWVGDLYQSGKPEHASRFKTYIEWINTSIAAPAQFTCGSTFKGGSYSRGNANLVRRAFLIVESDELDRNTIGAVFRWMKEKVGLTLRCIVDTAGKSLHGWFEFPAEEELNDLRIILPELGCDPKMFTASQPCRLAGALRDGRYQKLIYFQDGGVS
jgi:hypothetical protein